MALRVEVVVHSAWVARMGGWLAWPDRPALFAQMLFQEDGSAITLLVAERVEEAKESTWDPPRFRR